MKRLLVLFFCLKLCAAQQSSPPTYRSQTHIVQFPAAVYDKTGRLIDDLTEADFVVLDNGERKAVHVDLIGTYHTKIALVIVIQTSGISQSALLKIQKTGSLIEGYITGESGEAAILGVDEDVHVLQPFTADGDQIGNTFRHLKPSDVSRQACTLDGVEEALQMLSQRPPEDRRLILTISESRDRGSKTPFAEVLLKAQQANVSLYTLSYSAYLTPFTTKASEYNPPDQAGIDFILIGTELARLAKTNIAEALASASGGRHLSFTTLKGLENDLVEVGKEVHHQYLLSLTPEADSQPTYHAVSVSIKDHPKAAVHTRPGYWSVLPQ